MASTKSSDAVRFSFQKAAQHDDKDAKASTTPYNLMEEEQDGTGAPADLDDDSQSQVYFDADDHVRPLSPSSRNNNNNNNNIEETNDEELQRPFSNEATVPTNEEGLQDCPPSGMSQRLLTTHFLPSSAEWYRVYGVRLVEGTVALLYLKFLVITLLSIVVLHLLVKQYAAVSNYTDYDAEYSLVDFLKYDLNLVVLDTVAYFAFGRLYAVEGGCDVVWPFVAPMIVGMLFEILIAPFSFLQHSVSLYEIHCAWPWQLWVYVAVLCVGSAALMLHFVYHVTRDGSSWGFRLVEATALASIFIAPFLADANFHFHHWYFALVVGPLFHSTSPALWYAVPLQAYFWGLYINGIAVYGRDPILTCEYAYFVGNDLQCSYSDPTERKDGVVHGTMQLMHSLFTSSYRHAGEDNQNSDSPDWQHCT